MVDGVRIDANEAAPDLVDEGRAEFHRSLGTVLERIAPLTAPAKGLSSEDQMHRLTEAINLVVESMEDLTGIVDPEALPNLIERVAELAVTGDNIEVQIGVAGDLRIDKRYRLTLDTVMESFSRIPASIRPAALREGVMTLQRLLALLLLHGWTDDMGDSPEARQEARRAIVDTVQGRLYSGQPAA